MSQFSSQGSFLQASFNLTSLTVILGREQRLEYEVKLQLAMSLPASMVIDMGLS
jgi:hypothetical protein